MSKLDFLRRVWFKAKTERSEDIKQPPNQVDSTNKKPCSRCEQSYDENLWHGYCGYCGRAFDR